MIKKWIEFIKESKEESKKIWKLDKEEIKDLLIELIDLRYRINIELGIVGDDGEFSEIKLGEVNPAYWISINCLNVKSGDVTLSLLTMCDYLESKGYEVIIQADGILDRESLEINSGFSYKGDSDEFYDIDGDLSIYIKQLDNQTTMFKGTAKLDTCNITEKDFAEYYNWTGYELIGNNIYLDITLEELAENILSRYGYYDSLIDGINEDDYYNYSERPEIQSLFQYYLDKENEHNIVKRLIDDFGLEEVIKLSDELNVMNEEEIIEFILSQRNYTLLKELCEDSDIIDEIGMLYADMDTHSHISRNIKELYDAFDTIVEEEFKYTKFKTNNNDESDDDQYYRIKFDKKWIEDRDYDFLEGLSLNELFQEYCSSEGINYELKPNFSDYGDVNHKEFNKEVKSILK